MPDRSAYISTSRGYYPDWKTKEFDPGIEVTVSDNEDNDISLEIRKLGVHIILDPKTAGELSLKLNEAIASL